MSLNKYSYVRKESISQQIPPLSQVGVLGWLWKNLFYSMSNFNSISGIFQSLSMIVLTIWLIYFCGSQIYALIDFAIVSAVWVNPEGLKREVCATVDQGGKLPSGWYGACWPFIYAKKKFLIYGRIPDQELWRANIVYAMLFLGMGYIIWNNAKGRKWVGLSMLTIFPVISLLIMTGANFDISTNFIVWILFLSVISFLIGYLGSRNHIGLVANEFAPIFNAIGIILFVGVIFFISLNKNILFS